MTMSNGDGRRGFLRGVGTILLGAIGGGALASTGANANVFAGRFLKNKKSVMLPAGYYDGNTQLYRETATNRAIFVDEAGKVPVSQEELGDLLSNGRYVDISKFPKLRVADSSCTSSTQSTLSTTSCCPIVTDKSDDSVTDDGCTYP